MVNFFYNLLFIDYIIARTLSPTPKLVWAEFAKVLKVFMNADRQERDSDIDDAFRILDQQAQGLYGRTLALPDGFISPDEFRVFLEILSYQVVFSSSRISRIMLVSYPFAFSGILIFAFVWLIQIEVDKLVDLSSIK